MPIVFPEDWGQVGRKFLLTDIDKALRKVITEIDCCNLSYSGGIDSSLLLYYILEIKGKANLFTVVNNEVHPDLKYAILGREHFENRYRASLSHEVIIIPDCESDELVRLYYARLTCSDIITGDGIDELACGYYAHQSCPDEETYQEILSGLQANQLQPLNENSGNVRVYLPYIAAPVANLLYRIPLSEKVNHQERKLIIKALAQDKVPIDIIDRKKYGLGTSI